MTKKLKRPISFILSIIMLVSLFAIMPITASAAEETITLNSGSDKLSDHGITNIGGVTHAHEEFEGNGLAWGTFIAPAGKVFTKIVSNGADKGAINWTGSADRVNHDNMWGQWYLDFDTDDDYYLPFTITFTLADAITTYTVTWKNGDTVLETDANVEEGATPVYNGEVPTKPEDDENTYEFAGWTPDIAEVTADAEYTATFTAVPKTPSVAVDAYETLYFTQHYQNVEYTELHIDENPDTEEVEEVLVTTNDEMAVAFSGKHFSVTPPQYYIEGDYGDHQYLYGLGCSTEYGWNFSSYNSGYNEVTINGLNGDTLKKLVVHVSAVYTPNDPVLTVNGTNVPFTKDGLDYTFENFDASEAILGIAPGNNNRWLMYVNSVDAYYSVAEPLAPTSYTVTWKNEDGSVIDTTEVEVGTTPTHDDPTKAEDDDYTYTFAGWTPEITAVSANAEYTATFTAVPKQAAPSYVKVTENQQDWSGDYLIVYEDENKAFNGGANSLDAAGNHIDVDISGGEIASDASTEAAKVTISQIDGGYSIKTATGVYIGGVSNANKVATQSSPIVNTISFEDDIAKIVSNNSVLRYNATWGGFRYYKSVQQKPVQLYKLTTVPAPTYTLTCTDALVDAFSVNVTPQFFDVGEDNWNVYAEKGTAYNILSNPNDNKFAVGFDVYVPEGTSFNASDIAITMGDTVLTLGEVGDFDTDKDVVVCLTNYSTCKVYGYLIRKGELTDNIVADYVPAPATYTVTWKNYDGSVLETDADVAEGATPEYNGNEPTKPDSDSNTYTFAGWTPEVSAVTGDTEYTATFTEASYYIIGTMTNWQVDSAYKLTKNDAAEVNEYSYSGLELTTGSQFKVVSAATADSSFLKWFPEIDNNYGSNGEIKTNGNYTIYFRPDYNGNEDWFCNTIYAAYEIPEYTITWKNEDGSVIDTTKVEEGTTPTHDDPTKAADAQYTYTFTGWTPEVTSVTGDAEYTATFRSTVNEYNITWKNEDGSVIDTTKVAYGTVPTHDDATKAADAQYIYTFTGWTPEVTSVTGNAEYTATFIANAYDPLMNTTTLDSEIVLLGKAITINASATGGLGEYQYKVYYKRENNTEWVTKQRYSTNSTISIMPKAATTYDVSVKVKDSIGTVVKKRFKVNVVKALKNTSTVAAENIGLGEPIIINASATGGFGEYQYKVYYKREYNTEWVTKQRYSTNSTISIMPKAATTYDVSVKVKDSNGTVVKKRFKISVTKPENTSTVESENISLGESIRINCSATGGSGEYTYAVYYKRASADKWSRKQNYSANTSVSIKPAAKTTYNISVKVKDSLGNISKKYFDVTVS